MAWKKSPEWLVQCFEGALPPTAERRSMFGYPAAFVGGNLAFGLHEERFVLRVGETDALQLMAHGGKPFQPLPGRTMRGWVVAPEAVLKDAHELRRWVLRAMIHAASLAPKGRAGAKPRPQVASAPKRARKAPAKAKSPAKRSGSSARKSR